MVATREFMTEWGSMLLDASWQAALLAIVVAVICRLGSDRLSASWRFVLWGLVFVRLACPVLPSSSMSVWNLLPSQSDAAVFSQTTRLRSRVSLPEESGTVSQAEPSPQFESPGSSQFGSQSEIASSAFDGHRESDFSSTPAALSKFEVVWMGGLVVWAMIATGLLLRQLVLHLSLWRMAADWSEVTDPDLLRLSNDCHRQVGLRRSVLLLQTDDPVGPATLGVWRAQIILPTSLINTASTAEMQMILMHELHHVRRWDVLWDRLATLLTAVHWFNPAIWWAKARLRDEQEQACDSAVLHQIGSQQARGYGHLLMKLTEHSAATKSPAVLVGARGTTRSLHRRIVMITKFQESSWKRSVLGACVVTVLTIGGLTSAQSREPDETATVEDASPAIVQSGDEQQTDFTISGQCTDENGQPLSDVHVRVLRVNDSTFTRELVTEVQTDQSGVYRFVDLSKPVPVQLSDIPVRDVEYFETYYVIAATKLGRATQLIAYRSSDQTTESVTLKMSDSGTLAGRVTDEAGRPIQGARVFLRSYPHSVPIEGVLSGTTDAAGRYEITDLEVWDADKQEPTPDGDGFISISACYFSVLHPDYGANRPQYTKIPSRVDITLQPAAVIEGQVIDQLTGQLAVGATVSMQGANSSNGFGRTKTDEQGHYRLTSVNAGAYNIWADADERTCKAIDSLEVAAGEAYANQNIQLIEGSWLEGRLVDANSGEPISQFKSRELHVAAYGPSRPKSGAAVTSCVINENGEFRLRVAPGINFPYIMTWDVWQRTEDYERYKEGIEVGNGEIVSLVFRVHSEKPRKKPKFSPVRLKIPVPEEREAAAAVRRLGGWYELDDQKHVVEVNMVNHRTADGVRYDNDQTDTDEALQWVPQFKQLKRLYLNEGQATDESMEFIAKLSKLEIFFVWDAYRLSDAGVQHLQGLQNLREIHINESKIGDGSLAVFGKLSNLEDLSIQQNRFTNEGLSHLSGLRHLRELWIGMNEVSYSDDAMIVLSQLATLEKLDLQSSILTDAGIAHLGKLQSLRVLLVEGAPTNEAETITDASVIVLTEMPLLEDLTIRKHSRITDEGMHKLAAMPSLKQLTVDSTELRGNIDKELERLYPGLDVR